jgi:hypothetical protein
MPPSMWAAAKDASIRRYQGVPYLLIIEGFQQKGLSDFQVRDLRQVPFASPTSTCRKP